MLRGIVAGAVLGLPELSAAGERTAGPAAQACLFAGTALAQYGFPRGHPLGVDRQAAFMAAADGQGSLAKAGICAARAATNEELGRFHTQRLIDKVRNAERDRIEFLDNGDTPVFPGVFEASANVVGAALDGLERVMTGQCLRSFQPIGGLHHAGRDHCAGFCVFNDIGVVIETLRQYCGVRRVAYVDIDVHHGDGIFYAYEEDPDLVIADIHEDGRFLYPGTGREDETGKGAAKGSKLNIALRPASGDTEFMQAWIRVERHLVRFEPEFILFQCGADGLRGDPLAHLNYTVGVHAHATQRLLAIAARYSKGRLMAFGGGGYNRDNLAAAWSSVLREIVATNIGVRQD
ncbi:MAG: acetoin utilization protein AcuC [Betaproteobacteria bacterium]